jgi:superfamily II DNA helicase RecQ
MAALVRHFGDFEDAAKPCGVCDVCDPAGAVLRLFRRPTAEERAMALGIVDELRPVDYKATGTLQRSLDPVGRVSRDEFDSLLDAMVRAGLIAIEEAEFEKDGEVRRFRKVRLTEAGLALRAGTHVELLISDGVVEEFGGRGNVPRRAKKSGPGSELRQSANRKATQTEPAKLSAQGEALAARLKEWRTAEAKKLRVPAYCVLHDRTLAAVALVRPENPRQLLEIDGIGQAKVEKFGAAILGLCGAGD